MEHDPRQRLRAGPYGADTLVEMTYGVTPGFDTVAIAVPSQSGRERSTDRGDFVAITPHPALDEPTSQSVPAVAGSQHFHLPPGSADGVVQNPRRELSTANRPTYTAAARRSVPTHMPQTFRLANPKARARWLVVMSVWLGFMLALALGALLGSNTSGSNPVAAMVVLVVGLAPVLVCWAALSAICEIRIPSAHGIEIVRMFGVTDVPAGSIHDVVRYKTQDGRFSHFCIGLGNESVTSRKDELLEALLLLAPGVHVKTEVYTPPED